MKGLLIKEKTTILSGPTFIYYLLFAVVFGLIGTFSDVPAMFVYVGFLLTMLPYSTLTGDEVSGWESYSLTLPCTRRDYVNVKYISTLIMFGVSLVFVGVLAVVYGLIGNDAVRLLKYLGPICLSVPLLMPALGMPLMLKFGNEKGKVILIIIGAGCGLMCSMLMTTSDFVLKLANDGMVKLLLCGVAAAAVLFSVSWFIAVKLFESREF